MSGNARLGVLLRSPSPAIVLAGLGVIDNVTGWHSVVTLVGGRRSVPGGPAARWPLAVAGVLFPGGRALAGAAEHAH